MYYEIIILLSAVALYLEIMLLGLLMNVRFLFFARDFYSKKWDFLDLTGCVSLAYFYLGFGRDHFGDFCETDLREISYLRFRFHIGAEREII